MEAKRKRLLRSYSANNQHNSVVLVVGAGYARLPYADIIYVFLNAQGDDK